MRALIIYGQIRTFEICLNSILNYIEYNKYKYDVYLLIDRHNDIYYNEKNLLLLKNMLNEKNIKMLLYVDNIINIENEDRQVIKYFKMVDEIIKVNGDVIKNSFVTRLYNRRYKFINIVNRYIKDKNLYYERCIFTRFDINLEKYINDNINIIDNTKLYISFDTLFIGKIEDMVNIFKFSNNYFSIYNYYLKNGEDALKKIFINHNFLEEYLKIWYIWICMPELNFYYYLIINNINFIKLKYYNIIQR